MIEMYDVAKETTEVLKYFDSEFYSRIPEKIIRFLIKMGIKSNKVVKIDINKKLNEQEISEECKDLLSLLYYNYVANKEEKTEINKIWNENELEYQKELEQQYSTKKIFEKRKNNRIKIDELNDNDTNVLPSLVKENFLKRIIRKIKNYINKM